MQDFSEQLMPLAMAARYAGVTPEHLNLLARRGKLLAKKVGRNWFTSRAWLDSYFHAQKNQDPTSILDTADTAVELRRIEKEEKLELGRINAQIEFRRIEMQERIELESLRFREPPRSDELNQAAGFASEIFREELDKVARQAEAQIREIENEKQLMAEFFTRELDEIRTHLAAEQDQKQLLLTELERKLGEIEQSRVVAEVQALRESFASNLVAAAAPPAPAERSEPRPKQLGSNSSDWQLRPLDAEGVHHIAINLPMARWKKIRQVGAVLFATAIFGGLAMLAAPRLDILGTETLFVAEVGERMGAAMILTSQDLYERFAPSLEYHFADFSFLEPVREFYKPRIEQGLVLYTQVVETPVDMSPFTDQAERVIASFKNTADRLGQVAGATTFHAMPWQGGASTTAPPK